MKLLYNKYDTIIQMKDFLKKYFIPHEDNDHKPHFLRGRSLIVLALLAVLIQVAVLVYSFAIFPSARYLGLVLSNVLVDDVNSERVSQELQPLAVSPALQKAAQAKADDMAAK